MQMTAVLRIKTFSAVEIEALVSLLTRNGYMVSFQKGDRVTTKVIIRKEGQEYLNPMEECEI